VAVVVTSYVYSDTYTLGTALSAAEALLFV